MNCCDSDVLSRYVDGDLPFTDRSRLNEHLRSCHACRIELARLRKLDDVIRAWGSQRTPLPVAADNRIAEMVRARPRVPAVRRIFALGRMTPAAVGSTIAAVLVLLSVNFHGPYPSRSASEIAWATQQSSIKRQAAPLLKARRSSAILGGQVNVSTGTLGRHFNATVLN